MKQALFCVKVGNIRIRCALNS